MKPQSELKDIGDITAVATAGFSMVELLPAIAALFSIVWLSMRIFETWTGHTLSETRIAIWVTSLISRNKRDGD